MSETTSSAAPSLAESPFTPDCPGREVFNHITSRWALLILAGLGNGPMRFHLLRDRVGGISEKMLSQTLKVLVRDGLVRRSVEPTVPPQVSYALTEVGAELSVHFAGVIQWMGRRVPDILVAQREYDAALRERR
jgi:DNA-binding HxlR family transcriptional regulator